MTLRLLEIGVLHVEIYLFESFRGYREFDVFNSKRICSECILTDTLNEMLANSSCAESPSPTATTATSSSSSPSFILKMLTFVEDECNLWAMADAGLRKS